MRQTTWDRPQSIRWKWTLVSTFEALDFTSDLVLVSHTHQHMQEKTTSLSMFAKQIGLKIGQKKTEVMMLNVPNPLPVKANGEDLPITEESTYMYLGSTVRHDGGAENGIRNCLNKARKTFIMLNNMWKSSQYSTKTKLRL